MKLFKGRTANEVWQKIAKKMNADDLPRLPSRAGDMVEYLHTAIEVKNPRQRWTASRYPAINPAFALAEVVWIVNGSDDAKIINHWNPALPKFAGDVANYYGAYGHRLRHQFRFDQLERAYRALQKTPETRQLVLQIWSPETDFPNEDGSPRAADIPCNLCSLLKVREGKLEWTQVMRSNDLILGLPHNFVQFTYLQEIIAGWLGLEMGTYNHFSDSLHCYLRDYSGPKSSDKI
ncbi:MAG: thymidylate synthase [bacterium]|nr:thymidylate synthase [bacterium]